MKTQGDEVSEWDENTKKLNNVKKIIRTHEYVKLRFNIFLTARLPITTCDPLWENQPLSILFQDVVAAHKGSLVNNTVRNQFLFDYRIKIAIPLPTFWPNLKNYKHLEMGKCAP